MHRPLPLVRRRASAALAVGIGLSLCSPGSASAAESVPAHRAVTTAPRPQPCPGTGAPRPAGSTTAAPGQPPGATTTPTHPTSGRPSPNRGASASTSYPPPAVPHRDVVVGGSRLGGNGTVADVPQGTPVPDLNATSWVVADATHGTVLAAKAPHALLRPASTIKALTALVLLPQLPAAKPIVASAEDMKVDGTKVGIVTGNRYTVGQLFSAMLMGSANDAVHALARSVPGGSSKVVVDENALAKRLGALDTVVKDPAGLDVDGQVSSAYDLALVGRATLSSKPFRHYSTTKQLTFPGATMPGGRKVAPYAIQNHNRLLYNYPGTIGVKNGFTSLAHGTFVAAASRGGRTYLLTFMCADGISWRHMAAVFDWAFTHGPKARPVGELVAPGSLERTPAATPSDTGSMTPATAAPSAAGSAGPMSRVSTVARHWWGAGVVGLAVLGLGITGARRLGRGRHAR